MVDFTNNNRDILKREVNPNNLSEVARNIKGLPKNDSSSGVAYPEQKKDIANNILTYQNIKKSNPTSGAGNKDLFYSSIDAWTNKHKPLNSNKPNDSVVGVRDYLSAHNNVPLSYDDVTGDVFVAGYKLPVTNISDGRAYAKKSDIDQILRTVNLNPTSKDAIATKILNFDNYINGVTKSLRSDPSDLVSYRPDNDPAYKAYIGQIDRLRDDAIREAVSSAVGRTGGYMNSNAASSAYQVAADYDNMKADIIPTLENQYYNRLSDRAKLNLESKNVIANLLSGYNSALSSLYSDKNATDTTKYGYDLDDAHNKAQLAEDARQFDRAFEYEKEIGDKELAEKIRQFNATHQLAYDQLNHEDKLYLLEKWATEKRLYSSYVEPSAPTYTAPNSSAGTIVPLK